MRFDQWDDLHAPLLDRPLGSYPQLAARIEPATVRKLVDAAEAPLKLASTPVKTTAPVAAKVQQP